jgi:hypothetical protein
MMKKFLFSLFQLCCFITLILSACRTTHTIAEKTQQSREIEQAIEMKRFTFKANYAYPTGYRSVYLSPYYEVNVSPDTVKVHLPYFGRAYQAPIDLRDGGFNFNSTKFTYQSSPGKRNESWTTEVKMLDQERPLSFHFEIWGNGAASLHVYDFNKQAIMFQGVVEVTDRE